MVVSTGSIGIAFLSVVVGMALGSFFHVSIGWTVPALGASIFLLGIGVWKKDQRSVLATLLLCLVLFGFLRATSVDPVRTDEADAFVNIGTRVIGVIARDPDRRASSVHYVVVGERIGEIFLTTPVNILVNLPRYPEYAVGERLTLSATLALPKDFETDPSRPPFPYVKYLAKDGIGYTMRFPQVDADESTNRFPIARTLSLWKRAILEKGNVIFSEPEGGLLAGMILGERHALPTDILDQMRIAGLVHIIVVSGYNMTVVAEGVSKLFRALPLFARSGIGLIVVWVYAGMVSGGAPVIRAAIMTSFALLARMTGNTALALRLLYLSAIIMIVQNPRIVLDDASFHLSFLATLGLIVLSPKMTAMLSRKSDEKTGTKKSAIPWWKELFSATLSAQIMVVPYILFFSGQLSPYALPANLLALPVVPIAMGLGSVALIIGAFAPSVGMLLGAIASVPAWWVLVVGEWFAGLPGSGVMVPLPLWVSLALYGIGSFFFWRSWKGNGVDIFKK